MSTAGLNTGASGSWATVPSRTFAHLRAWIAVLFGPARHGLVRPWTGWRLARLIVGVAVVPIAMVWLDAWAVARLREAPVQVGNLFNEVTQFGKAGWFLWPIGLMLVAIAVSMRPALGVAANLVAASLVVRLGYVFVAVGLPSLLASLVKGLIGRMRPTELGPFVYAPLSWNWEHESLPSGHATTAFAAAAALGTVWPAARFPMWIYAGIIALSRVAILAHFPSDVIAGALVGVVGAYTVRRWFAVRRLGFALRADDTVVRLPGPDFRRIKRLVAALFGLGAMVRS